MRWPIRVQLFVPIAVTVVLSTVAIAASSAMFAAQRNQQQMVQQLRQLGQTLASSSFPLTESVLEKLRGLSGAHFVALDQANRPAASTLSRRSAMAVTEQMAPLVASHEELPQPVAIQVDAARYRAIAVRSRRLAGPVRLLILFPEDHWQRAGWEAAFPPLAIGAVTVLVVVAVSFRLAHRLARRIGSLESRTAAIAAGRFSAPPIRGPNDELRRLGESIDRMAAQLQDQQQTIRRTERVRFLGVLAGGVAHQLRNAAAGAKIALQVHQKRCTLTDESLAVAIRQLALVEQYLQRLLSLGRAEPTVAHPGDLRDALNDVCRLVELICRHGQIRFSPPGQLPEPIQVEQIESVRMAILDLVLNAVEAAGSGGEVVLAVTAECDRVHVEVTDTGPGPPPELHDTLCEPLVSSKPHGVGLGLALARNVAEHCGGTLAWHRHQDRTVFRLTLPVAATGEEETRRHDANGHGEQPLESAFSNQRRPAVPAAPAGNDCASPSQQAERE